MAKRKPHSDAKRHRVIGLSLIEVDIKQSAMDAEKEPDSEFQYDAEIDDLEIMDTDIVVFACIFALRKTYPDQPDDVTSITAKYYCGVRAASAKPDARELALGFAATTVWSSFSSLCAIATQQMGTSFPILPPGPDTINIRQQDET
ncbi:hypothetical protein [Rhizobium leguminosarum]|uniref:hypothetical protein n=1 Tax=Rhizobium leguminosarum TaxID=384 RepID=UPI001C9046FD|nr:hypothetical protein [Rhizobium leguminosarum]MBY3047468.1 hypothetical protein [Rhizobium leguminosarum]